MVGDPLQPTMRVIEFPANLAKQELAACRQGGQSPGGTWGEPIVGGREREGEGGRGGGTGDPQGTLVGGRCR